MFIVVNKYCGHACVAAEYMLLLTHTQKPLIPTNGDNVKNKPCFTFPDEEQIESPEINKQKKNYLHLILF